jgi:hypothetical protein
MIAAMKPATCTIRMDTSQGGSGIARSVHFVKPIDLSNIPNNLLRLSDCLAVGGGSALALGRGTGGSALAFPALGGWAPRLNAYIRWGFSFAPDNRG